MSSHNLNIVLVILDATRADHLSCYGYAKMTTPWLQNFAEKAVLYEQAISPTCWTLPSFASILSGLYPSQHGTDQPNPYFTTTSPALPEVLREVGYQTYCVSDTPWISDQAGFGRGFMTFEKVWQLFQVGRDIPNERMIARFMTETYDRRFLWRAALRGNVIKNAANGIYGRYFWRRYDDGAKRVNRLVRRWLRTRSDGNRPLFLLIHYLDPHWKFWAPEPFRLKFIPSGAEKHRVLKIRDQDPWAVICGKDQLTEEDLLILNGLYDGEIAYCDFRLSELFDVLEQEGVLNNALVIITADHGESLGEHGLMDHQYALYDTLLHVPLLIRFPENAFAGMRVTVQVQTLDIFPTILELLGISQEDLGLDLPGRTLIPTDLVKAGEREAFAEYLYPQPKVSILKRLYPNSFVERFDRALRAIRTSRYKYILSSLDEEELYDLSQDPDETVNLASSHKEIATEMRGKLLKQLGHPGTELSPDEEKKLDSELRRRLEALGYL